MRASLATSRVALSHGVHQAANPEEIESISPGLWHQRLPWVTA